MSTDAIRVISHVEETLQIAVDISWVRDRRIYSRGSKLKTSLQDNYMVWKSYETAAMGQTNRPQRHANEQQRGFSLPSFSALVTVA